MMLSMSGSRRGLAVAQGVTGRLQATAAARICLRSGSEHEAHVLAFVVMDFVVVVAVGSVARVAAWSGGESSHGCTRG